MVRVSSQINSDGNAMAVEMSKEFDVGEDCMQRHFYEHFQRPGQTGFFENSFETWTSN